MTLKRLDFIGGREARPDPGGVAVASAEIDLPDVAVTMGRTLLSDASDITFWAGQHRAKEAETWAISIPGK